MENFGYVRTFLEKVIVNKSASFITHKFNYFD